jgi:hypothetical protein
VALAPPGGWHRPGPDEITLRRVEVLLPGRPGLLDLVAEVNGRLAHMVAGLRRVDDEPHFLRAGDETALGLLEDDEGLAVCTDALRDAQLAPLVLATVRGVRARPGPVASYATTSRPPCSTAATGRSLGVPVAARRSPAGRRPSWRPSTRPASTTWRRRWSAGPGRA